MSPIQIGLLAFLGLSFGGLVGLGRRGSLPRSVTVLLSVVCLGGAALVIQPDLTTRIASLLGIGRGADLMLYLLILGTSWGLLSMYMRLRAVRRDMTLLVRRMALHDAERQHPDHLDKAP
jgi:hypothetical protein